MHTWNIPKLELFQTQKANCFVISKFLLGVLSVTYLESRKETPNTKNIDPISKNIEKKYYLVATTSVAS